MRSAILAVPLGLIPVLAGAQGLPSANQVYAGPTSGPALAPSFRSLVPGDLANSLNSQALDAQFGSTRGSILERGASGWGIVAPGTSGLPWVSNGTGADPAYQALTNSGLAQMPANTVKCNNTGSTTTGADCTNISLLGTPALTTSPTGNTGSTLSSVLFQSNAGSLNGREFAVNLGFTSAIGSGGSAGNDKVTLYAGMVANSGTSNVWSFNSLLTMSAGSGSYTAQGYELDLNNLNADRGAADGTVGLAAPSAYGLNVSGASTFPSTGAILISGNSNQWHRGIVIANSSVKDSSFQDLVSSTISLDIRGTHTYGADFNGCTCTAVMRLPNLGQIVWRNQVGNADVTVLTLDTSNNILVGSGGFSGGIFAFGGINPNTDNTLDVATSSQRWRRGFFGTAVGIGVTATPAQALEVSGSSSTGVTVARFTNTSTANNTTKFLANEYVGVDTVSTVKVVGSIRLTPNDSNWVGSIIEFHNRASDADQTVLSLLTAGNVKFNSAASFTANGAGAAVAFGATTPGAIATPGSVAKWLTIVDNAGNTEYIPVWH